MCKSWVKASIMTFTYFPNFDVRVQQAIGLSGSNLSCDVPVPEVDVTYSPSMSEVINALCSPQMSPSYAQTPGFGLPYAGPMVSYSPPYEPELSAPTPQLPPGYADEELGQDTSHA